MNCHRKSGSKCASKCAITGNRSAPPAPNSKRRRNSRRAGVTFPPKTGGGCVKKCAAVTAGSIFAAPAPAGLVVVRVALVDLAALAVREDPVVSADRAGLAVAGAAGIERDSRPLLAGLR